MINTYTEPLLPFAVFLGVIAIFLLRRGGGRRTAIVALSCLVLISWPPFDWLLSRHLEAGYVVRPVPLTPMPQAIVVQAGGVDMPRFERPYQLLDFTTFRRCEFTAWLHRQWPALPILATGGGGAPLSMAAKMREFLIRAGVPSEIIITEEMSHSTHESAVASAAILRGMGITRIALVVEGQSMRRAAACFRKLGIDVIPTPCEIRQLGEPWAEEIFPSWRAIHRNEIMLHETVGLVWYSMKGWI